MEYTYNVENQAIAIKEMVLVYKINHFQQISIQYPTQGL